MVRIRQLCLFLVVILIVSSLLMVEAAQARTIIVPTTYSSIQQAIDSANNGDTVFVKKGYYPETLVVNKSISLIGEDRNLTIVDAQKAWRRVILIQGTNILVENFTLGNNDFHPMKNSGWQQENGEGDGIEIGYYSSNNIKIINNIIAYCPISGIHLYFADNCTVDGNIIIGGIYAVKIQSAHNIIKNNTFVNSTYGAYLYDKVVNGVDLNVTNTIHDNNDVITDFPNPFIAKPEPSPTVPEFPHLTAIPLLLSALAVALAFRMKKSKPKNML